MKPASTLFLKAVVITLGIAVLALCLIGLPLVIRDVSDYFPGRWLYPFAAIMYLSAIPFFIALQKAMKLLGNIDKNKAFSASSTRAIQVIKFSALAISALYTIGLPFLFFMADQDDAPGLIVIGLVIIGASFVIAVFAAVLQKLVQNAVDMKSEHDLTV